MLPIYLCEDNPKQLKAYAQIIRNQLDFFEYDAQIKEAADNPAQILSSLKRAKEAGGLYILDIEFAHQKKNGLDLAVAVRALDVTAKIIFITTHSEMSFLTFERKVEPFDYILKDRGLERIKRQLEDDLRIILERRHKGEQSSNERFSYKVGNHWRHIPMHDLLFLETSPVPHRVILHGVNTNAEFIGTLAHIQTEYPQLFRCHKSFLINPDTLAAIDSKKRLAVFPGDLTCDVSHRKLSDLRQFFLD
ncbi:MAG: response regulator transcription factor [Sporolactobacillus sp.]